jgi:predicted nuclease of predicted toxin-antitoxin system
MEAAASTDRVLVSADTDFGELLAIGSHPGPSVTILRRVPHRPEVQTELLLANLDGVEQSLDAGAVVVVSAERVRFRLLPISREE